MSLAWIKVDREKKTHSVYSDGRAMKSDMASILEENKNKTCAFDIDGKHSILIGCAGDGHAIDHISEHFQEYFAKQEEIAPYTIENGKTFIRDLFETYTKEYKKVHKYHLEVDAVVSIDGVLYKLYSQAGGAYECSLVEENFACVGYPEVEATIVLLYDNDADPQRMLTAIASRNTSINNKLFKIENVNYV